MAKVGLWPRLEDSVWLRLWFRCELGVGMWYVFIWFMFGLAVGLEPIFIT